MAVVSLVGCVGEWQHECRVDEDCDDQNVCTVRTCDQDPLGATCHTHLGRSSDLNGNACDWDGVPGVCVDGVCGENLCEDVVCEPDEYICIHSRCVYQDGTCEYYPACEGRDSCGYSCDRTDGSCVVDVAPNGTTCIVPTSHGWVGSCRVGWCVGG